MKRLLYLVMAALMVLAVSCNKDNKPGNDDSDKYGVDGITPMPEAVDIGLVVNGKTIKWASFNLGASKEYEYGAYYAWAETEPKVEYSFNSYKHYSALNQVTAYCPKYLADYWDSSVKPDGPDGVLQILPSDDAAHVHLGGAWRLPTGDELLALVDLQNDTEHYEWEKWAVINADGEDVYGLRITQKSTGNSTFFPAAGACSSTQVDGAGTMGYYWSSSLTEDFPYGAYGLFFDSESSRFDGGQRIAGFSVLPVCEE